jgi:hypothetical protein
MDERRLVKLIAIAVLTSAGLYAFVGLSMCGWVIVRHWPVAESPPSRPTLASVTPAPIDAMVPIAPHEPNLGSFGVPAGWHVKGNRVENDRFSSVSIFNWPLPPGVPLTSAADRLHAAKLEAHLGEDEVSEPVEVTVGKRNAIEVAASSGSGRDSLHVFLFSARTFSHVTCHCFDVKWSGSGARRKPRTNWDDALPACAAVVASLQGES